MSAKKTHPLVGLGLSRDYFSKNLIPVPPELYELCYYSPSSLFHYDGLEFLYVLDGKGSFCVNGHFYPCTRGNLTVLSFYHLTRIIPQKGTLIRILRCRLTLNTLLYFLANPCCPHTSLGQSEEPAYVKFEGTDLEYIESLFHELEKELSINSPFHDNMSIYMLMELIARIDRLDWLSGETTPP